MAIIGVGSFCLMVLAFIFFKLKQAQEDLFNPLAGTVFVFPPSLATRKLQFIEGRVQNIYTLPNFAKSQNIIFFGFLLAGSSMCFFFATYRLNMLYLEELLKAFIPICLLSLLYFLFVTIPLLLMDFESRYYLKFGILFGSLFIFCAWLSELVLHTLKTGFTNMIFKNYDLLENLKFYFGFSVDKTLVDNLVIAVFSLAFLLISLTFVSASNTFFAFRIMHIKLKTINSDNDNVKSVLARYTYNVRICIIRIISNLLFFIFLDWRTANSSLSIILFALTNLILKIVSFKEELNIQLLKFSESVFAINRQIESISDNKRLTAEVKEKFILISKSCNALFQNSITIFLKSSMNIFLLLCLGSFLILLSSKNDFPGFYFNLRSKSSNIPKNQDVEFYKTIFLAPVCTVKIDGILKNMLLESSSDLFSNFWWSSFIRTAFYGLKDVAFFFVQSVLGLYLAFDTFAFLIVILYLRRIKF